ncbi:MAG: DinB family protein [Gemmatimonadota bacterium]|nr:DinB family protein [Gemmatimonadota bacterium]
MTKPNSVAPFYGGWRIAQDRLVARISELSPEQLELRAAPHLWPIWAITAHTAGARVYWLCHIFKEPGAERTPFTDPTGMGWEDDLTHPRQARELVSALEITWTIVEDCLTRWTPEMLQDEFPREINGKIQMHTRQSVLIRLLTHDAYHCGEIAQALGMHGLEEVDIWTGRVPILQTDAG